LINPFSLHCLLRFEVCDWFSIPSLEFFARAWDCRDAVSPYSNPRDPSRAFLLFPNTLSRPWHVNRSVSLPPSFPQLLDPRHDTDFIGERELCRRRPSLTKQRRSPPSHLPPNSIVCADPCETILCCFTGKSACLCLLVPLCEPVDDR